MSMFQVIVSRPLYYLVHNEKDNKLVIDKYISWIKAHI